MRLFMSNDEVLLSLGFDGETLLANSCVTGEKLKQSIEWTSLCLLHCEAKPEFVSEMIVDIKNGMNSDEKDRYWMKVCKLREDIGRWNLWMVLAVWAMFLHAFSRDKHLSVIYTFLCAYHCLRHKYGKDEADKFAVSQKQIISDLFQK